MFRLKTILTVLTSNLPTAFSLRGATWEADNQPKVKLNTTTDQQDQQRKRARVHVSMDCGEEDHQNSIERAKRKREARARLLEKFRESFPNAEDQQIDDFEVYLKHYWPKNVQTGSLEHEKITLFLLQNVDSNMIPTLNRRSSVKLFELCAEEMRKCGEFGDIQDWVWAYNNFYGKIFKQTWMSEEQVNELPEPQRIEYAYERQKWMYQAEVLQKKFEKTMNAASRLQAVFRGAAVRRDVAVYFEQERLKAEKLEQEKAHKQQRLLEIKQAENELLN